MNNDEKFEERLTLQVSVQIIKHISSGLYRSPASALKELISNAFDADAKKVEVEFHFSYDKNGTIYLDSISISDNGSGMNLKTLEYIFTHIGGSLKDTKEERTPSGREIIGRLGIGMLSVASACRSFVVRTKRESEEREYSAEISLSFFEDVRELTETMDKFSIGNVKLSSKSVPGLEHYTKVEIRDFKPPFLSNILDNIVESYFFQHPLKIDSNGDINEQYELYFSEFLDKLFEQKKLSNLPILDQIIATMGLMTPVEYLSDGPVRTKVYDKEGNVHEIPGASDDNFVQLKERLKKLDFEVYVGIIKHNENGNESKSEIKNNFKIYKPLLYPSRKDIEEIGIKKLDPHVYVLGPKEAEIENEPGNKVKTLIRGYVYHQYARILPHEYRGILFRVYKVAIGDYFKDELRLYSEDPLVLHQMFAEVYLDQGFQTLVNLDRESLYEGARTYQYLKAYLESFFKGKSPEVPPSKPNEDVQGSNLPPQTAETTKELQSTSIVPETSPSNRDVSFYKTLQKMIPGKKGGGIISDIKTRRSEKRSKRIKMKDPNEEVKKIAEKVLGTRVVVERTSTLDDFGTIDKDPENDEAIIKIPRFQGSRSKTWEGIFTAAAVWGPKEAEDRIEFMKILYSIYTASEGE
ncbi:MAG: ATP-binding protein [Thermoplasmatales archaeon]